MNNDWHSFSKYDLSLDINTLVEHYYNIYLNELKNDNIPLIFEGKKIVINSRKFDCQDKFFINNIKNCNNSLFDCKNCPFLDKDEMFFHIASNRDAQLLQRFKSKYRNYQKSRLPGLFEKHRLIGVKNIRTTINSYLEGNKSIICFDEERQKERIIYFWAKEKHFIVVIGFNLWDKKQKDFYLKSAYTITSDSDELKYQRLYNKYKKRQVVLASRNPL